MSVYSKTEPVPVRATQHAKTQRQDEKRQISESKQKDESNCRQQMTRQKKEDADGRTETCSLATAGGCAGHLTPDTQTENTAVKT